MPSFPWSMSLGSTDANTLDDYQEDPAWVPVGYPRYCPEILDMITLDEVVYDLAVRKFAYRTDLYGVPGTFDAPQKIDITNAGALDHWNAGPLDWNSEYRPWFYRDVWPILFRVDELKYLNGILNLSNAPHDQTERGSFDPTKLSVPPVVSKVLLRERERPRRRRTRAARCSWKRSS